VFADTLNAAHSGIFSADLTYMHPNELLNIQKQA